MSIETHQECGVVANDLAVALKVYSIQTLDAPRFAKLLIMLGNLYLELAFYGVTSSLMFLRLRYTGTVSWDKSNLPTTYGGIRRAFEESDGWRPWPSCPTLEHVCPYSKQIAQGPDANSTY